MDFYVNVKNAITLYEMLCVIRYSGLNLKQKEKEIIISEHNCCYILT